MSVSRGYLEVGHLAKKNAERVHVGVRASLKKPIDYGDPSDKNRIETKENVIVQPVEEYNELGHQKFRITVYEDNKETAREDQEESKRDVIIKKSVEVFLENPKQYIRYNNEHSQRSEAPLFKEGSPCLDDINQGRIPDCFLLAALQSILNHPNGSEFIKSIMHQTEHGTTIVKLYHPEEKKFVFKEVNNDLIIDRYGKLNTHKALWVHVIENAYTALGWKSAEEVDQSFASVYSNGGRTELALQRLTGLDYDYHPIQLREKVQPWDLETFLGDEYQQVAVLLEHSEDMMHVLPKMIRGTYLEKYDTFAKLFGELTPSRELIEVDSEQVIENTPAMSQFIAYFKFYIENKDKIQEIIKNTKDYDQILPLLVENFGDNQVACLIFNRFFQSSYVQVGDNAEQQNALFCGRYHKDELEAYTGIEQALKNGQLIGASTYAEFDTKVPGLSSRHAYSVLGVRQEELPIDPNSPEKGSKTAYLIKLRNPWGTMGRCYDKNHKPYSDSNSPIFEIELKDFCRHFSSWSATQSANQLFEQQASLEKIDSEITQAIAFYEQYVKVDSSVDELLEALNQYHQIRDNMIQLHLRMLSELDSKTVENIESIFSEQFDEELEKNAILGLIDEKVLISLSQIKGGDIVEVKTHAYLLLKLNWLNKQAPIDNNAIEETTELVMRKAFLGSQWEKLAVRKQIVDGLVIARAEQNFKDYNNLMKLIDSVKGDIATLKSSKDYNDILCQSIVINYFKIAELYQQVTKVNLLTKQLHLNLTADAENQLANEEYALSQEIHKLEPLLTLYQELKQEANEIINQVVDLERREKLTETQSANAVETVKYVLTNQSLAPEHRRAIEELEASGDEEVQHLGKKIGAFARMAEAFKNLWQNVKDSWSSFKVRASNFFQTNSSYQTRSNPADDKKLGLTRENGSSVAAPAA